MKKIMIEWNQNELVINEWQKSDKQQILFSSRDIVGQHFYNYQNFSCENFFWTALELYCGDDNLVEPYVITEYLFLTRML